MNWSAYLRTLAIVMVASCSLSCWGQEKQSFIEDSTIVYVSCDTIRLSATLAIPTNGQEKHPAVVLVSGTGKQDRDCNMAGHLLFKEISDYLVSQGIAVLRSDDRGVGGSTGCYEEATTYDFALDALAAVEYLKSRTDIDCKKIGLIGHSEGGAAISIATSQSPDVAFMVSLSGLMLDGLSALIRQNRDLIDAYPLSEEDKKLYNDINERMFNTAFRYADSDNLEEELMATYNHWRTDTTNAHIRFSIYMYTIAATSPWYRFHIRYNPAEYLSKINVPVLLINGEKDVMVNAQEHSANALRCLSHNPNVESHIFPGLNHLLLPCEKGIPEEYWQIESQTSSDVLNLLGEWILQQIPKSTGTQIKAN